MDYKTILAIIAVGVGIAAYIPYIRNIFLGKTKPHAFSWFIWGVLTAIGFAASITQGGGAGAWVTGATSLACFFIAALAFAKGAHTFPTLDWLAFFAAFASIFLWWLTKTPTLSVILVSIADAISFIPTYRKGYHKPHEETAILFALDAVKFLLGIAALHAYSIATVFYPASVAVTNFLFFLMIIIRRRQGAQHTMRGV